MMLLLILVVLTILQFVTGFGVLRFFRLQLKPALWIALSILTGLAVFSIVPFILQLVFIPLTEVSIFSALAAVCLVLNIGAGNAWAAFYKAIKTSRFRLRLYELPFLLLIGLMVFVSAWRCYYYPPTPRDLNSGAEAIAEYAVREKTMINSVFTADLSTTNNQFKPPFVTCLQIIYKYAGFPFGQVWLINVFVCFLIFLYHVMVTRLHKIIAGILLVAFIAIPEMYAYTIMALFDYSNSVFFCIALYFLIEHFYQRQTNLLALSGMFMTIATYIRSETLVLAALIFPVVLFHYRRQDHFFRKVFRAAAWFIVPSLLIYILTITVYIGYYLPAAYDVGTLVNNRLLNLEAFYQRISQMTGQLLLAGDAVAYYSYFVFLFVFVLLVTAIRNAWNRNALNWLFAVFALYVGIPFLGYIFPLYDLDNSTKRGLFKIFPLMLLFMANSQWLISVSERIKKWEENEMPQL